MLNRTSLVTLAAIAAILTVLIGSSWCRTRDPTHDWRRKLAADPHLEAVVGELLAAWDNVSSVSAMVATKMEQAIGKSGWTTGMGQYDLLKDGEKTRVRFKINNLLQIERVEGSKEYLVTTERLLWVTDGDVLYQLTHQYELRKVTKSRYDPDRILQIAGKELFRKLQSEGRLKVLPDETLDGKVVYVIEARAEEGDWRTLHYIDKQTGIRLKMVEENETGETTFHMTLSDVELDPGFDADHFTFTMPEGTELIDET